MRVATKQNALNVITLRAINPRYHLNFLSKTAHRQRSLPAPVTVGLRHSLLSRWSSASGSRDVPWTAQRQLTLPAPVTVGFRHSLLGSACGSRDVLTLLSPAASQRPAVLLRGGTQATCSRSMPDGGNGTGSALSLQCSFSSWFVYIGLFLSKNKVCTGCRIR